MLDTKSVQKVSKHSPVKIHSKTDLRYWRDAVYKPKVSGGDRVISQWYVKIQHQSRRETFPLRTNNQDQAAESAKRIYLAIVAKGWEAVIAELKPGKAVSKNSIKTVGELILASAARHDVGRRTVADYVRSFRFIVGQVLGMGATPKRASKEDMRRRAQRIDATFLTRLKPSDVERWRQRTLEVASGKGMVELRKARNTVNSVLRKAKSLLSSDQLKHLDVGSDFINPLQDIDFEPRQSTRYHSALTLEEVLEAALHGRPKDRLEPLQAPELKAFLLASLAGLRRNEIDKLEWSSFIWERNLIRLKVTEHFNPKTEESLGEVDVDPELMAKFRELQSDSTSKFVVESSSPARLNTSYAHYRCSKVFERLNSWLRNAGVTSNNPLHTLRKEFGSLVCSKYGIYVASRALRHRDIYITSQHYVDAKQRFAPGLSRSLCTSFNPKASLGDER